MAIPYEGIKYQKHSRWWPVTTFYDIAGYPRGWIFSVPGTRYSSIFTVLHIKTSKIMERDKYATVIGIFGREWRIR